MAPKLPEDVAAGGTGAMPITSAPPAARPRRRTSLAARGEPMVWLTGGAIGLCLLMIVGLLGFVFYNGFATFWPGPLERLDLKEGKVLLGEPTRGDVLSWEETHAIDAPVHSEWPNSHEVVEIDRAKQVKKVRFFRPRTLYRVGNFDISGERFVWVNHDSIAETSLPPWALVIERLAWGNAYGILESITVDDQVITDPAEAWSRFQEIHPEMQKLAEKKRELEDGAGGEISKQQDEIRLRLRGVSREHGEDSAEYRSAAASVEQMQQELNDRMEVLRSDVAKVEQAMVRARITIRTADGKIIPENRSEPDVPMRVADIVRAYPANQLDSGAKASVYLSRWGEYLSDDPREANTEGGVFPAIIGTVMLTFIMILFVVPIGVIAALYLREYAKQGLLVSIVRISVNNLAGVPSIVYGVFGLGFFCYFIGAGIDQLLFADRLPDPTVGKSAMIWASLTLALLTLPVIIVATEEALAAVPRSMREGSYACGASKWQTIRRIVLPRALPGIMTGTILAIARGAGEVAPLMLVGAVKLAPDLPISGEAPWFGTNRSFMHLGFHIYDLGFQSPDSEAARSMVYTTTLLLIGIVVALNISAMLLRSRLRRAYAGGQF